MLLVGSQAAYFHFLDFRVPKDWDVFCTISELSKWVLKNKENINSYFLDVNKSKFFATTKTKRKFEFSIYNNVFNENEKSSAQLFCEARSNQLHVLDDFYVASPQTLLFLKTTHITYPIHWDKNIEDYHFLKSNVDLANCENKEMIGYMVRKYETDKKFKNKKSKNKSLKMSNDDFFLKSKSVERFYLHDDLHVATSYYSEPLYSSLKYDKTKAFIDKELFDKLQHIDKIRTVREECYAIALERKIIPGWQKHVDIDSTEAFNYALKRVCTTLTSGWFRWFAIENWPEIRKFDVDYVGKFTEAVNSGKIKRISI